MSERYLEDFVVGQIFVSGRLRVTKEQIKAFAAEERDTKRLKLVDANKQAIAHGVRLRQST